MQGYKIFPQVQLMCIGAGSQPSPTGLEDSSAYSCFKVGVEGAYQFPAGATTQGHIKCQGLIRLSEGLSAQGNSISIRTKGLSDENAQGRRVMEISRRFSIRRVVSYCRVTAVQVHAVL